MLITGNDGLYGGLGGDFTVITASEINGPLVLRHELGHSLIEEGDEYDGSTSTRCSELIHRFRIFRTQCCSHPTSREGHQVAEIPV